MERYLASPSASFRPWVLDGNSPQRRFLRAAATHRTRVFRGGNRSGKTTVGAFDLVAHLTGTHPFSRFMGPVHWWVSGISFRDAVGAVIWPAIKQFLPADEVQQIVWMQKVDPETPLSIVMKNGSTCRFKSVEQGRTKYQGERLHGIWIDEEHTAEIVEECRARLLDYAGYLTVTLTPVRRERWVRQLEQERGTFCVQASTMDAALAGTIDLEATKAYAASLPERQRRVRILGDHVTLEGAVYPDFAREVHCAEVRGDRLVLGDVEWPWPLPASWPRWAAIDFGFANPTAIPLAVQDPYHDRLIVTRVLYASQIRATRWAAHVRRLILPLTHPLFADHDAMARAELEAEGVPTVAAQKEVDSGLEAVERLLLPRGDGAPGLVLVIDESLQDDALGRIDAEKLAWELENYHYKAPREGAPDVRDAPVKSHDHACDGLRYLVMGWERRAGGTPEPPVLGAPPAREDSAISLAWPEEDDEGW